MDLMNKVQDEELPSPVTRRKRRYTHSVYVCERCRKSHRKCVHSPPETSVAMRSDEKREISAGTDVEDTRRASHTSPSSPLCASTRPPVSSIIFYVEHALHLFTDTTRVDPAANFWRFTVPQMVQQEPFLRDALLGLTYMFKECPRPEEVTAARSTSLIENTFLHVQGLLRRPHRLERFELVQLFLGTSFLAIATFLGTGSIASLRVHLNGLRAVTQTFYPHLVQNDSPLRQYFLGYRPPRISMTSQIPLELRHIRLVEPILKFIPTEQLLAEEFTDGTMIHMLTLTNRAIRLSEKFLSSNGTYCPPDHEDFAIFRELCEGRIFYQRTREMQTVLESPSYQRKADSIREVFEQTIFIFLKQITAARTEYQSHRECHGDFRDLKFYIETAKRLDPLCTLIWPETIYSQFVGNLLNELPVCYGSGGLGVILGAAL